MKSERHDNPEATGVEYPCLMEGPNNEVVLFAAEGKGTVVYADGPNRSVGGASGFTHHVSWIMEDFKKFEGSITLSN